MSSDCNKQTATKDLFKAVPKYAAEAPVIIVATEMDQFEGIQRKEAEEIFEPTVDDEIELWRICKKYATDQLPKRMNLIEEEMREVQHGHFDACVSVAQGMS